MTTSRDGIARPLFRALVVLGFVAGGAAGWIALAPISGAVIAEGRFKVDGDVKTVQHLDGGVVAEIAVRDGDRVQQGDLLLKLDATDAEAALGALEAERDSLVARQIRLEAERDDLAEPDFGSLGDRERASLASAIANQAVLFTARRAELAAHLLDLGEHGGRHFGHFLRACIRSDDLRMRTAPITMTVIAIGMGVDDCADRFGADA